MAVVVSSPGTVDVPLYVTLRYLSSLTGISVHTLRHWIQHGRLNQSRGLRAAGRRWLVEWAVFKAALDSGEF